MYPLISNYYIVVNFQIIDISKQTVSDHLIFSGKKKETNLLIPIWNTKTKNCQTYWNIEQKS